MPGSELNLISDSNQEKELLLLITEPSKMTDYIEKISKLAAAIGCPVNFVDQLPIKILKDEIVQLTSSNAAKRKAIHLITDEIDKMKTQITSVREQDFCIDEEMDGNHQRTNILKNYMETIQSSDTFPLNKMVKDVESHIATIYDPMMEIHERCAEIMNQLEMLRKLQSECDDLRKQVAK